MTAPTEPPIVSTDCDGKKPIMQEPGVTQSLLTPYRALAAERWADQPGWLGELRAAGYQRFATLGLPTQKQEAWKYTSLRPLERMAGVAQLALPIPDPGALPPPLLTEDMPSWRLVFVNGQVQPALSRLDGLPPEVTLTGLAEAIALNPDLVANHLGQIGVVDGNALIALNTAYLAEGAVLHVPRGAVLTRPIELVMLGRGGDPAPHWHPRLLIIAEDNSEATVVERHNGNDRPYFANLATEIALGAGARLHHYKWQGEGSEAAHLSVVTVRLARDASYDSFVLSTGAKLSRNEVRTILTGPGITTRVNGGYLVRDRQHCDNTTLIDHAAPHCASRQVYQGVIDGHARAVFQGRVVVRPGAQKTDGYQLNRALLLSDHAEIDSKPELEIFADDVKCSHGATAGALEAEALFYLRARGIPLDQARALLIRAFLGTALDEIKVDAVREAFAAVVDGWLENRR